MTKYKEILIMLLLLITGIFWYYTDIIPTLWLIFFAILWLSFWVMLIFKNLSNKVITFIILIIISISVLFTIYYFFIGNVGYLKVKVGNIVWVNVDISWEFWNSESKICNNECTFSRIPPVNYSIKFSKDGYKEQRMDIKLSRSETKLIVVEMKKNTQAEIATVSKIEKIAELKYKKYLETKQDEIKAKSEKDINGLIKKIDRKLLWTYDSWVYSYSSIDWDFIIYFSSWDNEENIFSQKETNIAGAWINIVDGIIYYKSLENNYFYDISKKSNFKIDINDNVQFVKKTPINEKYIISGKNWMYIYNIENNDYTKNTLFDDFTILESGKILWLINSKSKDKINLLNFIDNGKSKLILHDIETRERKVIFETNLDIRYLFNRNSEVKYLNGSWILYKLKQLDL